MIRSEIIGSGFRVRPAVVFTAALAAAGMVVFYFVDPASTVFLPECAFHEHTGLYCAGCGGLRAVHALVHGDLPAAVGYNLFIILVLFPITIFYVVKQFVWMVKGSPAGTTISTRFAWFVIAGVIIFTVVRNIPVHPFEFLSP